MEDFKKETASAPNVGGNGGDSKDETPVGSTQLWVRNVAVMRLLALGFTKPQIAERLEISKKQVQQSISVWRKAPKLLAVLEEVNQIYNDIISKAYDEYNKAENPYIKYQFLNLARETNTRKANVNGLERQANFQQLNVYGDKAAKALGNSLAEKIEAGDMPRRLAVLAARRSRSVLLNGSGEGDGNDKKQGATEGVKGT